MITWFNNILDLQYYHPTPGLPCYCELLIYPSDLMLQGSFAPNGSVYTVFLYVYSADGVTQYEDATGNFDLYIAQNPVNGDYFFNAKLETWAESMCEHECFVIRAVVAAENIIVFDKYTERYCQSTCCDEPRDITFSQDGVTIPSSNPPSPVQNSKKYTECNHPVIRLISDHDCYDPFAGIFYGIPDVVIQGDASFPFVAISTFKGRIAPRPTEILREISYNCRLQRVTSARLYLIEGFEYFPTWKMLEIQSQLHARHIYVDDYTTYKEYQFTGGTPLAQINACYELFKLKTELQDCEIRKIYGCDEPCGTPILMEGYQSFFVITQYNDGGFYDDSRTLIAEDIDGLIDYIRNLNGVTGAGDIIASPVMCDYYAVVGFSWAIGYTQPINSIYADGTGEANRIYAVGIEEAADICNFIPVIICAAPEFTLSVEDSYCAIPEFTLELEYTAPEEIFITDDNGWVQNTVETEGTVNVGQVLFNFTTTSTVYVPTGEVDEVYYMNSVLIGIMSSNGRPIAPVALTPDNSNMPADTYLEIDENGQILYTGEPTDYNVGASIRIQLENLVYNIN